MKNSHVVLHRIAFTAILATFSTISFILENLIPPIILPGSRIGISNIFIIFCLVVLGEKYAFPCLIVKVLLGSLFSGNISAIIYSLPAGLVSLIIQAIIIRCYKKFSIVSASTIGAVINSIIQNVIFCFVTNCTEYLVYLPYLSLIAILGGLVVGFAVYLIVRYLPENIYGKLNI